MFWKDALRFSKLVHLIERNVLLGETKSPTYIDFEGEEEDQLHAGPGQALETAVALMKSCVESQKSAADAAQILAFWAQNSPRTRAMIARAAKEGDVVQALTQTNDDFLLQLYPLLARSLAFVKPQSQQSP